MHPSIKRFLCIAVLAAPAIGGQAGPLNSYLRADDTIVFVGDGLTANTEFTEVAKRAIRSAYPESKINVVKAAAAGAPIASFRGPVQEVLAQHSATVAVIMLGLDEVTGEKIPSNLADTRRDLKGLINSCRSQGLDVILMRPPWLDLAVQSANAGKRYRSFTALVAVIDAAAREMRVPVIDVHRAYSDTLAAARTTDPEYAFAATDQSLYQSGSAVIAGEIVRAFGVGLPLSEGQRGPLRGRSRSSMEIRIRPSAKVAESPGRIPIILSVANRSGSPVTGFVELAAGLGSARRPVANLRDNEEHTLRIELPTKALPGRTALDPLRATLRTSAGIVGAQSIFHHSRVLNLDEVQFAAARTTFIHHAGDRDVPCPVRLATVDADTESISFVFMLDDWSYAPVNATRRPAPLGVLHGINYDCVIVLVDLRLTEAAGRSTMNATLAEQDILRIILTQWGEESDTMKMFVLPSYLDQFIELTSPFRGKHEVKINARLKGRSFGFDIVAFNALSLDAPATVYNLAGTPLGDPARFIRASVSKSGVFYRIGF